MSDPHATAPRDLVVHVAGFSRALRERGVATSLADEADALEALALIDIGDRQEVRRGLRVALKVRPADAATFEELFAEWWRTDAEGDGALCAPYSHADRSLGRTAPSLRTVALPGGRDDEGSPRRVVEGHEPSYSADPLLRRKPFDACTPAELLAMERLLTTLARRLATRPSRRLVPTRGRGDVDLRRSFRRAVERPRLVALCDTSGSMDPHARLVLAFLLALRGVEPSSELFAFNTTLVRLTTTLRPGAGASATAVRRTLARLAAEVPDWSGGTRIGECLADFADRHLDALVDNRTVVLILSDGLDRGDVAPLAAAMRAIRRRARRVLWLNPLAGDPRYEATARAMAAALPHVDKLLPAHDLAALERMLPLLAA